MTRRHLALTLYPVPWKPVQVTSSCFTCNAMVVWEQRLYIQRGRTGQVYCSRRCADPWPVEDTLDDDDDDREW